LHRNKADINAGARCYCAYESCGLHRGDHVYLLHVARIAHARRAQIKSA
jgi:hypothetical protein